MDRYWYSQGWCKHTNAGVVTGHTVLEAIEAIEAPLPQSDTPFRAVVIRSTRRGLPVVRIASGAVRPGMTVHLFPGESSAEVECVRRIKSGRVELVREAGFPGEDVELTFRFAF